LLFFKAAKGGFAMNLLAIELIPDGTLITLLGASDYIFCRGLKHLEFCIAKYNNTALFISNWSYYKDTNCPIKSRFYTGDVGRTFCVNSITSYLRRHTFAPNGIMQYTGTKETLLALKRHVDALSNPQLGIFFDVFPQHVVACAGAPLTLVKHVEATGWRSSKEKVILTHMLLACEMRSLLCAALKKQDLKRTLYRKCLFAYLKTPLYLLSAGWGEWQSDRKRREDFTLELIPQILDLSDGSFVLRAALFVYYLQCTLIKAAQACMYVFKLRKSAISSTNPTKNQPTSGLVAKIHSNLWVFARGAAIFVRKPLQDEKCLCLAKESLHQQLIQCQ
jgi:hypothetical protein